MGRVLHTSVAWLSATGGGGAAGHRKRAPARRANRRMVNRRQEDYFRIIATIMKVIFRLAEKILMWGLAVGVIC